MSKPCKYCGKEITWDKSANIFTNPDGSKHDCRTEKIDKPQTTPTMESLVREIIRDELKRMKG